MDSNDDKIKTINQIDFDVTTMDENQQNDLQNTHMKNNENDGKLCLKANFDVVTNMDETDDNKLYTKQNDVKTDMLTDVNFTDVKFKVNKGACSSFEFRDDAERESKIENLGDGVNDIKFDSVMIPKRLSPIPGCSGSNDTILKSYASSNSDDNVSNSLVVNNQIKCEDNNELKNCDNEVCKLMENNQVNGGNCDIKTESNQQVIPCSDNVVINMEESQGANKTNNKTSSEKSKAATDALSQLLDYGISDSEDSESDSVSISDTSDTNSELSDEIVNKPAKNESSNRTQETFRKNDDSSSDSSTYYDSDSSTDSGDVGACAITPVTNNKKPTVKKMTNQLLTKGELTLEELPAIEQLQISVPEQECVQIGVVSSIVEQLVIVQSQPGSAAYDIDTLLFLDHGKKPLGRIFDVLGPVTEPFYAVRFNSYEEACSLGVKPGTAVYCAPYNSQHTAYVFVSELLKMKGSDASWKHNNEPPEMYLDYSDDEQEAVARRIRTTKPHDTNKSNSLERNKKFERQMNNKNILMNERYNQPSTSRRTEQERKGYQPLPNTPYNWSVPQAPRAIQRPEFCMPPYQFGYFNQYSSFPIMPQFNVPPMAAPNMFHAPQPFNPHVPPPIMRPQPVSYFPNPRHARWGTPPSQTNNLVQPPRGNFGNGGLNQ